MRRCCISMCRWWDRAIHRVFGVDAPEKELRERELGGRISRSSAVWRSLCQTQHTETQTHRHTDTQTHRHTQRHTHIDTTQRHDSETRHRDTTQRKRERETERQKERETETGRDRERQGERQRDRDRDRQTHTHRDRHAAEAGDADFSDIEKDEQQLADVEDTHAPGRTATRECLAAWAFWGECIGASLGHAACKKTRGRASSTRMLGRPTSSTGTTFVSPCDAYHQGRRSRGSHAACGGPHPGAPRLLEGILVLMHEVAWAACVTLPGRAWPDCFGQAKGHQGEGPAASLHLEFPSGVCPMPAQKPWVVLPF